MSTALESIINYFNPKAGIKRAQAIKALEVINTRSYTAVSKNNRNTLSLLRNGGAVSEAGGSFKSLAVVGNELVQNNPLASRIVSIWANNAVGSGVMAEIRHTDVNSDKALKLNEEFIKFCKKPTVGVSNSKNFYKIQNEIVHELVTCGGVIVARQITKKGELQLQLIEQSRLSEHTTPKYVNNIVLNGIEYDKNGAVIGYWIDDADHLLNIQYSPTFISRKDAFHVFSANKGNQHLGVSWFANIALTLDRYATLNEAKIMQQQVSACFSLIVEEPELGMGLGNDDRVDELEPALISYVKAGSVPHVINPPKADNGQFFEKSIKADIAVGVGLTYEMLTGDYSSTNFASGRMSRSEFNTGLESLQQNTLEPMLTQIFDWWISLQSVKAGIAIEQFSVDWAFPTTKAVNPVEEHDLLMSKVRHGMLSPSKACKLGGENFDNVMKQWVIDKAKFGELPFDVDPSQYARTGNQLNTDDASSSNFDGNEDKKDVKKDKADDSNTKSNDDE